MVRAGFSWSTWEIKIPTVMIKIAHGFSSLSSTAKQRLLSQFTAHRQPWVKRKRNCKADRSHSFYLSVKEGADSRGWRRICQQKIRILSQVQISSNPKKWSLSKSAPTGPSPILKAQGIGTVTNLVQISCYRRTQWRQAWTDQCFRLCQGIQM